MGLSINAQNSEISLQHQRGKPQTNAKKKSIIDISNVCIGRSICSIIVILWLTGVLIVSFRGDVMPFDGDYKGKLRLTNTPFQSDKNVPTSLGTDLNDFNNTNNNNNEGYVPLTGSLYKKALPSPATAIDAALQFMRGCTAHQRVKGGTIPILCVALQGAILWSNKLYINVDDNPGVMMYTSWYISKEASMVSNMDVNSNNNSNNNNSESSTSSMSPLQREIFEVLKTNYINLNNITKQRIYYSGVARRDRHRSSFNISNFLYKSHGLPKTYPFERDHRNHVKPIEVYWITLTQSKGSGECDNNNNNNNNIPNKSSVPSQSNAPIHQGNDVTSVRLPMYAETHTNNNNNNNTIINALSNAVSSQAVLSSKTITGSPHICTERALFPHISSLIPQQTDNGNHNNNNINNNNNNNYPPIYTASANTIGYYQAHVSGGGAYSNLWHVFVDYFTMVFHTIWDSISSSAEGKYEVIWLTRKPTKISGRFSHWNSPKPLPLFNLFMTFFRRNYVIIDDPVHVCSVVHYGGGDPPSAMPPESEIKHSNIVRTVFSPMQERHDNNNNNTNNSINNEGGNPSQSPSMNQRKCIKRPALHFNIILLGLRNICSPEHDNIDTMECRTNIWTMRNHILRDMYGLDPNKRVCMRQPTDGGSVGSRNRYRDENNNNNNNSNNNKSINTAVVSATTTSECSNTTFIVHVMSRQTQLYRRITPYNKTLESIDNAVSTYFTTRHNTKTNTIAANTLLGVNNTLVHVTTIPTSPLIIKHQVADVSLHSGLSFREQIISVYNSSILVAGRGAGSSLCIFLPIGGGYLSISSTDRWAPYRDLSLWWMSVLHHKAALVHHIYDDRPPKLFSMGNRMQVDVNRAGYLVIPREVGGSITSLLGAMEAYGNTSNGK